MEPYSEHPLDCPQKDSAPYPDKKHPLTQRLSGPQLLSWVPKWEPTENMHFAQPGTVHETVLAQPARQEKGLQKGRSLLSRRSGSGRALLGFQSEKEAQKKAKPSNKPFTEIDRFTTPFEGTRPFVGVKFCTAPPPPPLKIPF